MFLTTREKRNIIIAAVITLLIVVVGVGAYLYVTPSPSATSKEKTAEQKTENKEESTPPQMTSYTQYDKEKEACVYYDKQGSCYVPLSFCVNDPEARTPQELDREKYCSEDPQLSVKALKSEQGSPCPFTASEGDVIDLYSIVRDPDEDDPAYKYGPLGKLQVTFSEPFKDSNGIWITEEGNVGIHRFTVSVTDGEYTETKEYCIEVREGNRPPVLSNVKDKTIIVGETVTLEPVCTDPDGDKVTIAFMGDLSDREWMTSNTKETGPKDIGEHDVTVICRDSRGLPTYKTATITVLAGPPEETGTLKFITELEDIVVKEGETITLKPKAESTLGKPVTISYTGWMTSNTKKTTFKDAGDYKVTIIANDGTATIQKTVDIHVINVNRPPEIVGTEEEE